MPLTAPSTPYTGSDTLIIYVRNLLIADGELAALQTSAGGGSMDNAVVRSTQRTGASYPRYVISADEGNMDTSGDNSNPKVFNGRLRIELVAKKTDVNPNPDVCIAYMKSRLTALLLGDKANGIAQGIKGKLLTGTGIASVSAVWKVTNFDQIAPTGALPVNDPMFERWQGTYRVQLLRKDL